MTVDISRATADELRAIAERGAVELDGAGAQELLQWTEDTFGDSYIVASNMQDGVLVHLAAQVHPGVDVLFLDTGYHFPETIGTRDAVEQVYGVNVINARALASVAEQDVAEGKDLFARDPNRCCALRKVAPLKQTLSGYSAWVTGIRRVEAPTRANAPLISFDEAFGLVKINRSLPGRTRRCRTTSTPIPSSSIPLSTRDIRPSAAHPAPASQPPAAIRVAVVGPVPPRQNAGCTHHDS